LAQLAADQVNIFRIPSAWHAHQLVKPVVAAQNVQVATLILRFKAAYVSAWVLFLPLELVHFALQALISILLLELVLNVALKQLIVLHVTHKLELAQHAPQTTT